MPQFNITATSAKTNQTVSNTDEKRFRSPAQFENQADADKEAKKYAESLKKGDHNEVWDWVGTATPV